MVGRLAAPVTRHGLHDSGERVDRRHVAVDEGERLAVVNADTDLQANLPAGRVVDHPAHLEATNLAGDDTVFDDGRCATGFDRRDEGQMPGSRGRRRRQRLGHGRPELAPVHLPDRDRGGEGGRPARQQSGVALSEEMQTCHLLAPGPGERRPEPSGRIVLDQHPRELAVDEGTPGREGEWFGGDVSAEVVTDQGAQLQTGEPAASVARRRVDDRATSWPTDACRNAC